MKIGLTLASEIALGTSCALFWVTWCWLGMWGIDVRTTQKMTWPSNCIQKQLQSRTRISGRNN